MPLTSTTCPVSATGACMPPAPRASTGVAHSWRLTNCTGLVLICQLLGLPCGIDVILHLGQSLQKLAGSQGRQSAAPGLLEGWIMLVNSQSLEVVKSTLMSDKDKLMAKAGSGEI